MEQKKIRIGILSTAEIAHKVVLAIQSSKNAVAAAVASRSLEKASKWAKDHDIPLAYGTYQELVDSKEIDAIYIPLPSSLKKEWALKSAAAGKPILLEKMLPALENISELKEITDLCEKQNVQFLDGTMWLHSIRTKEIQKQLDNKTIGEIKRVIASFTFHGPDEEWLNGGNGRTDKTREPFGILGDMGWYPIGAIMFGLGYQKPLRVQMNDVEFNKVDTIIACSGTIWFENGKLGHFDVGANAAHRSQFEIVGKKGTIRVEDQVGGQGRSGEFEAYFNNFIGSDYYKMDDITGKESIIKTESCNHTVKMIENFAENILNGKPDTTWPQKSLACQQILIALFKSATNNNSVVEIE